MTTENNNIKSVTERDAFFLLLGAYLHNQEGWNEAKQQTKNEALLHLTGLVERFVKDIQEKCPEDYERLKADKSFMDLKHLIG